MEVEPGVYTAESLTTVEEGKYRVSIINANNCEVTIEMAPMELDVVEDEAIDVELVDEVGIISTEDRIREVRKQFTLGNLSAREQRKIPKICVIGLAGDKLTRKHWVVHAIPTAGIDLCRGLASRNYGIPEALKEEVKVITEQMLEDGIIRHSTSRWNSPIILVRKSWTPRENMNGD
jgi:hypothetical protein